MHKINSSVGRGGRNVRGDVIIVQMMLNRHIVPPTKPLVVDGVAGSKTVSAILVFQLKLGIENCDGRVKPHGKTFQALASEPKSVQMAQALASLLHDAFLAFASVTRDYMLRLDSVELSRPSRERNIPPPILRPGGDGIAWGAKVSTEFKKRVIEICKELQISPDYLMTCMALETGETFRADIKNPTSSATGLIQFLRSTALDYNTTVEDLAKMTPVEQLEYVRKYFIGYKGKLRTMEDVYMRILCPAAIGKGVDAIVYDEDVKPREYELNKGFDKSPKDGKITVEECSIILKQKYKKGLQRGYYG